MKPATITKYRGRRCASPDRGGAVMRRVAWLVPLLIIVIPMAAHAQPWSGILDPSRAIDWSNAGIPGGIPNRTTVCATINAGTYGNGGADATAGIQNALNNCAPGATQESQAKVLKLSAGKFLLNGTLN